MRVDVAVDVGVHYESTCRDEVDLSAMVLAGSSRVNTPDARLRYVGVRLFRFARPGCRTR